MARVLCAYSGIDFKVEHFLIYNTERQSHHPIFDLDISDLLALSDSYLDQKFTQVDNYLYYLALLKSTELVQFRVPAMQTALTQSIIANNMISLLKSVERIHILGSERAKNKLSFPQFVITPDTKDLSNTRYWLDIWEANYNDYLTGYKSTTLVQALNVKESLLESRIKNHDDPAKYATLISEWAALAGAFPEDYTIWNEHNKDETPCAYWKRIIKTAARGDSVFHIPMEDIDDVIAQCEDHIFNGNGAIQAHALMRILRDCRERKHNYLDLGDIDIRNTFKILDPADSVEDANLLAMILSAPKTEPVESAYPNKLAYRLAKIKYSQAVAYYKDHPEAHPEYISTENEPTPLENKAAHLEDSISGLNAAFSAIENITIENTAINTTIGESL